MFELFEEYEKNAKEQEAKEEQDYSSSHFSGPKVFVLSLGGSLFFDEKPLTAKIAKFAQVIARLHENGHRFVLVVGGGKTARSYVASAKSFGATNFFQDEVGIAVTRANALVFISALEKAHKKVLLNPFDALEVLDAGKIPVFGGILPSFTTDAVAALVTEAVDGEFVYLTDVDGVFSSDPKKSRTAKLFEEISYSRLLSLAKATHSNPGQNFVIDIPCINILKRSRLRGVVLNGNDLENFEAFVSGGSFKGTVIQESPVEENLKEV